MCCCDCEKEVELTEDDYDYWNQYRYGPKTRLQSYYYEMYIKIYTAERINNLLNKPSLSSIFKLST